MRKDEIMINKAYDKLYSSYRTDMANVLSENKMTDKTVDEAIHEDLLDKQFSPVEALYIVNNFANPNNFSFVTLMAKDIKLKFINYALRLDNPFETVEEAREVCEDVKVELSDDILEELLTNRKYEVDY